MFTNSAVAAFAAAVLSPLTAAYGPPSGSPPAGISGMLAPVPIFYHPLYVENAPQSPVPYITTAYSHLQGVALGPDVFRFAATRNSTGNAFSVVLSATTGSSIVGWSTTPHFHARHYETFYPIKGRMQVWANDQSRLLTPGDLGVVPENVTHVFEILDPDTYFVGIQAPGGFEDFFFIIGQPLVDSLDTPYNAFIPAGPPQTPPPQAYGILENVGDFWPVDGYMPNNNLINGSAPASNWHVGANSIPTDGTSPYFMARSWGPYYLHSSQGLFQVIQPLVTQASSGKVPFSMSTISLSLPIGSSQGNSTRGATRLPNGYFADSPSGPAQQPVAFGGVTTTNSLAASSYFFVEEGRFVLTVSGFPAALLTNGDSAFMPAGTPFEYYGEGPFTKVLYASGGAEGGLDEVLINGAQSWSSPMFPYQ